MLILLKDAVGAIIVAHGCFVISRGLHCLAGVLNDAAAAYNRRGDDVGADAAGRWLVGPWACRGLTILVADVGDDPAFDAWADVFFLGELPDVVQIFRQNQIALR